MRCRRSRLLAALILVSFTLLFSGAAAGQEQSGAIQGTVRDATGAVLPGAQVEARSDALVGGRVATRGDTRGVYRFAALPPGRYTVAARAPGFNEAALGDVVVVLGQTLTVDLALGLAAVAESVTAVGQSPLVDTTQSAAFVTVPRELIDRLSAAYDFSGFIAVAPGARAEPKAGGQAQIDGASGSENVFVIDGVDTTHLRFGTEGKPLFADFVEQLQVKSSGYNAEFGGSTGGVVNVVTRSGGNALRGMGSVFVESNWGMGESRPVNRYSPWDNNKAEADLVPFRAPWRQYTPLGEVAGPILRDRAWYFVGAALKYNKYNEDAIFILDPALASRHIEKTDRTASVSYNGTVRVTNDVRLKVAGSSDRGRIRGVLPPMQPAGAIYYGTNPALKGKELSGYTNAAFDADQAAYDRRWVLAGQDNQADVASGNLDWTVTQKLLVNAAVGYFRTNYSTPSDARGDALVHNFGTSNSDAYMIRQGFPTVPLEYQQSSGYTDGVSSAGTLRNLWSRGQLNANLTWFPRLAGEHTIKAGVHVDRRHVDVYDGYVKPRVNLGWGRQFQRPDGRVLTGKYGYYGVVQSGSIGVSSSYSTALWLQDSWRVGNRLTLNAGLRAEREHVPTFYEGSDAYDFKFGFTEKLAPRVGFTLDPRGDGRSKIYASYGHFFDVMKLEGSFDYSGGLKNSQYIYTLDTYDWKSISCNVGPNAGCPGTPIYSYEFPIPSKLNENLTEYFGRPMSAVDPDTRPMQTREAIVGGELQVGAWTTFSARYVHKWLIRTIEDVGVLIPSGEEYILGNPGFGTTRVMDPAYPNFPTPPATRKYDALELRARRRFSGRWFAEASYTFSRLWGNYSGLASSDEDGRTSPGVLRYYDALYMSYDRTNQPVYGVLATDRPHVFGLVGVYDLPWGTSVGIFGFLESGLPRNSSFLYRSFPVMPDGRNDLGRTAMQSQVGLNVQHEFRLGRSHKVALVLNVFNLFDSKTPTSVDTTRWRDSVTFTSDKLFFGGPWQPEQLVALNRAQGTIVRDNAFYMEPYIYQNPREVRFGVKYSF